MLVRSAHWSEGSIIGTRSDMSACDTRRNSLWVHAAYSQSTFTSPTAFLGLLIFGKRWPLLSPCGYPCQVHLRFSLSTPVGVLIEHKSACHRCIPISVDSFGRNYEVCCVLKPRRLFSMRVMPTSERLKVGSVLIDPSRFSWTAQCYGTCP